MPPAAPARRAVLPPQRAKGRLAGDPGSPDGRAWSRREKAPVATKLLSFPTRIRRPERRPGKLQWALTDL